MSGNDWAEDFALKYGTENVQMAPNGNHIGSIDDLYNYPELLNGINKDYLNELLGTQWTEGVYGSSKLGWQFNKSGEMISFHPGGGIHGGSYYTIRNGEIGIIKIVGPDYIDLLGDRATIIRVEEILK